MKAQYWAVVMPLIRPVWIKVAWFFAALLLCLVAVWGIEQWQAPAWKAAQQRMRAAQAALKQTNTDLADIERLRDDFARYTQSGLVGGVSRAGWVEDLQRLATNMGLESVMTYNLASPTSVTVAGATPGKVTRHVLTVSLTSVHELEAMQLIRRFVDLYPESAHLTDCEFNLPKDTGLALTCKINLLNIYAGASVAAGAKP